MKIEDGRKLIADVMARHVKYSARDVAPECAFCGLRWPCDSRALCDALEKALEVLAELTGARADAEIEMAHFVKLLIQEHGSAHWTEKREKWDTTDCDVCAAIAAYETGEKR